MLSIAFVLFCLLSAAALLVWAAIDVYRSSRPRGMARYVPDRRQLVILQWRRRQALRRLGSRWVLHSSQPFVSWGNGRG